MEEIVVVVATTDAEIMEYQEDFLEVTDAVVVIAKYYFL